MIEVHLVVLEPLDAEDSQELVDWLEFLALVTIFTFLSYLFVSFITEYLLLYYALSVCLSVHVSGQVNQTGLGRGAQHRRSPTRVGDSA